MESASSRRASGPDQQRLGRPAGRIDVIAAHGCSVLGGAREPGPIGAGSGVE